jgi:hypothetical protein
MMIGTIVWSEKPFDSVETVRSSRYPDQPAAWSSQKARALSSKKGRAKRPVGRGTGLAGASAGAGKVVAIGWRLYTRSGEGAKGKGRRPGSERRPQPCLNERPAQNLKRAPKRMKYSDGRISAIASLGRVAAE